MVLKLVVRNVIKRKNGYFFRIVIPEDFRVHFEGLREKQVALGTCAPLEAIAKAELLRREWKGQKFTALRSGLSLAGHCSGVVIMIRLKLTQSKLRATILHRVAQHVYLWWRDGRGYRGYG